MKRSSFYSIFKAKCPVCHQGDVFDNKGVYDLRNIDKMHTHCSHCGHKYEKEHGFWYGAMYVSYGLTVMMSVMTFVICYLLFQNPGAWFYIGAITLVIVLAAPFTFRISRLMWMNMFSHFDPLKAIKNE